ncbi:methionyl-tRNA formyltransferase [Brevibacterium sp.]|uniref:methionyl-tRNA formyltransferase n=1 Tax=Brevibacterium sp. TaxID=1701 RepID=UPI0025BDEF37|nr:methionyl-tRNA formyltransferase [Brevibacterium sp.]
MRIAFAGTPAVAVPALRALAASDHEIVAVLTRPDAPVGRKRVLTPSPVKSAAAELGLRVLEAERLRGEVLMELEGLDLDAVAVVAYGGIAGPRALRAARAGWFNLHFSLLPQWRGAAPVQRALMAGQTRSGLTVFRIDEGMDTGPVLLQRELPLPEADAGSVLAEYAEAGAGLLVEAFDALAAGTADPQPQTGAATHAAKIDPAEARLDLGAPAASVLARYRGVSPAPGAWVEKDGKRTKLAGLTAAPAGAPVPAPGRLEPWEEAAVLGTGGGAVRVARVQPFGKPMMDAAAFLRGHGPVQFDMLAAASTESAASTETEEA